MAGNTATLNSTLWYSNSTNYDGNVVHTDVYTGDPAFATDGYHLSYGSAAMDQGVNAGVTTDVDGESRPQGDGYDLGADELRLWNLYLPLVIRGGS